MADYKITRVSDNPPRQWSFTDKRGATVTMETYKVMLEGINGPVDVNRKPGNAPNVGDVLSGTISSDEYGQKFKAEKKPFAGAQASNRDQEAIRAQWAIGQAINIEVKYQTQEDNFSFDRVEINAGILFQMVESVKTGNIAQQTPGYDKFKQQGQKLKSGYNTQSPVDPFPGDVDPIDPIDIPF